MGSAVILQNYLEYILKGGVNILEKKREKKYKNKSDDKLPFAVFVLPKNEDNTCEDYKQIFTDIISDRINEKFK